MTVDKIFLADLSIAVTRVWEAFTCTTPGGDYLTSGKQMDMDVCRASSISRLDLPG